MDTINFSTSTGFSGEMSAQTWQALLDTGLLNVKEHPQPKTTTTTNGPCVECNSRREIGSFCTRCFTWLRIEMPGFAAEWHTKDWREACQQAEREVSNAAD